MHTATAQTPAAPDRAPWFGRLYSGVARRVPILSGLTHLAFNRLTDWSFGPANRTAQARTHSGLAVTVDLNDYHGRILYLFGTNDPKVQALSHALLNEGDTFLEIGANYSSVGLYASRKVGPRGHVHLFEPQPRIADRVVQAIGAAGLAHVSLHRVALLDRDSTMTMRMPPKHSGMATLVPYKDQTGWLEITVTVRRIDDFVAPLVAGRPFGVKLDVQGAEPALIPWLVAQPNLRFMIFEAAHNFERLFEQISQAGLVIFGLRRNLVRKQVERVGSVAELRRFHDLVAVRVGATPRVLSMQALARAIG